MPAIPTSPRVKLRSASRRVPRAPGPGPAAAADNDPEPTMPLSRAILVIFLLHIVAIGGYLSFVQINARRDAAATAAAPIEAEDAPIAPKPGAATPGVRLARPGETPMRIANAPEQAAATPRAAQEARPAPTAAPAPNATSSALDLIEGRAHATPPAAGVKPGRLPADSGKQYVVGKGESAFTIAQKLHVGADALLKLNGIDDPKKLRPGQKLRVPAAAKARS